MFERRREWTLTRSSFAKQWRTAEIAFDAMMYLTPVELDAMGAEIGAIIDRYRVRLAEPGARPDDARPVAFAAFGFPLPPTSKGN